MSNKPKTKKRYVKVPPEFFRGLDGKMSTPKTKPKKKVSKVVKVWVIFDEGRPAKDVDDRMFMVFEHKPARSEWHEDFSFVPATLSFVLPAPKKKR